MKRMLPWTLALTVAALGGTGGWISHAASSLTPPGKTAGVAVSGSGAVSKNGRAPSNVSPEVSRAAGAQASSGTATRVELGNKNGHVVHKNDRVVHKAVPAPMKKTASKQKPAK